MYHTAFRKRPHKTSISVEDVGIYPTGSSIAKHVVGRNPRCCLIVYIDVYRLNQVNFNTVEVQSLFVDNMTIALIAVHERKSDVNVNAAYIDEGCGVEAKQETNMCAHVRIHERQSETQKVSDSRRASFYAET